jgi:hypothetical protein
MIFWLLHAIVEEGRVAKHVEMMRHVRRVDPRSVLSPIGVFLIHQQVSWILHLCECRWQA